MSLPSIAVSQTMEALCAVTQGPPIGTNLALLHFLWMQISGSLLPSRGALFPALQAMGLLHATIRCAWAAFRYADWHIAELLSAWEGNVTAQGQWQAHHYDGYRPKAIVLSIALLRHFAKLPNRLIQESYFTEYRCLIKSVTVDD